VVGTVAVARPDADARSYSVLFAIASASSPSRNVVTETTGPKVSFWKNAHPIVTAGLFDKASVLLCLSGLDAIS
jgi:hypothetical protein